MLVDQTWRYQARVDDIEFYERLLPREHRLDDALHCVDWQSFVPLLESYYARNMGQPAIPPLLFLKLEFLKYQYHLSDREVIARTQTDIAFRWFLKIPVRCVLPDPSCLTRFRARLGADGFKKVFEQLVVLARQAGLVQDRLRLKDASHVIAKIAIPSTMKLLARLRGKMLAEVARIDPEIEIGFQIELTSIRTRTDGATDSARIESRVSLLQEVLKFLQEIPAPDEPATDTAWINLQQLCELASKILDDTEHPEHGDRILSLIDTDARRGRHGQWYDGYCIDISMDADSGLLTTLDVLIAGGDEAKSAVNLVTSEQEVHGNQIENFSIDGVGFNGPMIRALEDPEGLNVKVYMPTPKPSDPELFSVSEFALSEDGKNVTCPEGKTSSTRQRDDARHRTYFQFRRDTCVDCPVLSQCKPKLGEGTYGGRGVTKNDYEAEHQHARDTAQTDAYTEIRKEHPAVERKLNEIVNHHDMRHAKYWGLWKTKVQAFMTGFTVNVKRMSKLSTGMLCAESN